MKNRIINEFQTLINGVAATRPSGWQFKIGMYRKAQKAFKSSKSNVSTYNEAKSILSTVFKNPNSISNKIKQLFETGKINQVEKLKNDPTIAAIKLLSSVPYIGQVKAKSLVNTHSIKTIAQLKDALKNDPKLLNENQKLGLYYYNDLINTKTLDTKRIPRSEIHAFYKRVLAVAKKHNMTCEIAGSFRRKMPDSGDVDIIMTGEKNNMKDFIKDLSELKEHFASGDIKWMGIAVIDKLPRRVDIMYTKPEEYPFALMYFTGSQEFNEKFRGYARTLGYTLNEHGIKHLDNRKVNHEFKTEKDIFEFLRTDYISPEKRITFIYKPVTQKSVNSSKTNSVSVKSSKSPKTKNVYNVAKGVTLADTYDETKHKAIGMLMSEKYDGVRAIWNGKTLRTRANKVIYAPQWFTTNFPTDVALDGELFTERGKFQETVSIIKKIVPINSEWRKITYKVFDSPSLHGTYVERYEALKNVVDGMCSTPCAVDYVRQSVVTSMEQMDSKYKSVLATNGEGLMLRNPKMSYVPKRTKDLLKVKPIDDNEAIIVNMMEGKGKDSGRMGALVVELKNNRSKKFKIGTGFTDALRHNFWNRKKYFKNKLVTFSYKGLTNAGKPRHPVYVRMRNKFS